MEWYVTLLIIIGSLLFLFALRIPIAFAFLMVDLIASFWLWGPTGPEQLILSFAESVGTFILLPLPLFILMGTVIFYSDMAPFMLDSLDKWIGRVPGRLGLLAVAGGTVLSTFTGASVGSVALLGQTLVPEMRKRGYKKAMCFGPILGSGGLAIMIPPTGLGVLLAVIGEISVGRLLIAIIIPGLVLAITYTAYIVVRCILQPSLAPSYDVPPVPFSEKVMSTVRYVLPFGLVVFLVVGVIFLGIATPTEAAATGAFGTFILAAFYRRLNRKVFKKSVEQGLHTSLMVLMIVVGANSFSQILGFTGASSGAIKYTTGLDLSPVGMFIIMQLIVFVMGMFMDPAAILMVTLPLFMPIVRSIGINELVFGVVTLMNIEMAVISPPFGFSLFVMRGVAPDDTDMKDMYLAAFPFMLLDIFCMILIMCFPQLAIWLPKHMF